MALTRKIEEATKLIPLKQKTFINYSCIYTIKSNVKYHGVNYALKKTKKKNQSNDLHNTHYSDFYFFFYYLFELNGSYGLASFSDKTTMNLSSSTHHIDNYIAVLLEYLIWTYQLLYF